MTTPYPGVEGKPIFACVDAPTRLDELDQAGISWKYYTPFRGSIWTSPLAVKHFSNKYRRFGKVGLARLSGQPPAQLAGRSHP